MLTRTIIVAYQQLEKSLLIISIPKGRILLFHVGMFFLNLLKERGLYFVKIEKIWI